MRQTIWSTMAALEEQRTPYVLVTVVRSVRPSSARPGMRAVVTADGRIDGFIGGQCTRHLVLEMAREVLARRDACLLRVTTDPVPSSDPGVVTRLMTCQSGGEVELLLEPHLPPPVLVIIGGTPIADAVRSLAEDLDYTVHQHAWEPPETLEALFARALSVEGERPAYLIASQGEYDEDALLAVAAHHPSYVGVVASPRRAERLREVLIEAGASPEFVEAVSAPAGLDLGAVSPAEVALSILAELLVVRRRTPVEAARPVVREEDVRPSAVLDPVCGMTVDLNATPHTAVHQGTTYGFCGRGCLQAFLQDPASYAAQSAH